MWKTVALRMTQAKSEIEKMGEDTDGMLESTAKYRDLIKASTGFDILEEDNKTLKSTYEIILNIGKAWGSLSDIDRNSLLYALAGTRQSNALAAALTNIEDMEKAYQAAENSAGSAQAEQEKYTKSIQYSLDVFKATKEELANNLYDSQGLKDTIDMFTSLLEIINKLITSIGGLGTAFTGLMAYKGLKGQGIFDIFHSGQSMLKNMGQFFTQPILTQKGIDLGLNQDSIARLTQYNNLLQQNVSVTSAYKQTMKGASETTKIAARDIANGSTSLNELTVSSKAAAVGMQLLHTAMNAALAFGIALLIRKISDLHHAQEEAIRKSQELAQSAKDHANAQKDEREQLNKLIQQYKELAQSDIAHTIDGHKQLKELQADIVDLVGHQIDNLDLVNGRLDAQLAILKRITNENLAQAKLDRATAYRLDEQNYRANEFNKNRFSLGGTQEWGYVEERHIIQDVLNELGLGYAENSGGLLSMGFNITFNSDSTASQQLEAIDEMLQRIENDDTMSKDTEVYKGLLETRQELADYVKQQNDNIKAYLDIISIQENDAFTNDIQSYSDYVSARKNIIDNYLDNSIVQDAMQNGFLSQSQLEASVDNYLSTLPEVSKYYEAWLKNTTQGSQSDYEKAKSMLSLEDIEVDFDYSEYKEKINETTDSLGKLSSAYAKLVEGNATSSDVLSLIDEFPKLAPYANDMSALTDKVKELGQQTAEPLIKSLNALAKTVKDPEQKASIEALVINLQKMASLSEGTKKTADAVQKVTAADYIKWEEDNIQKIIDKLDKEKDAQNEVLDSLKSQKETLEQTISDYEKVADVVGKYIDRTQIEPLNDRKTEIEEYYNTEIEKLKEENEERSKNIELQEKQDALANARKQKNRVYTETEGWVWKQNNKAIRDAQKDLADLQNTMSIESLEKTRDAEVKNIDEQIKSWEKYKDEWKRQVEQITEADNELMASKVLGVDWQDQVASQSVGIMTAYGNEYASYNNRLKNQVEVEIAQTEKVINERDKEIEEWKDYKNDISNLNTSIETSNEAYLESLNNLVLDENSTWEDRVNHLKRNVEIIKQLNAEAASANLTQFGSGMYTLYQGDELVGWGYSSEKEAKRESRKIAENIAKNRTPQNAPAGVIESIIQSIMNSMHIKKYVKKYARGGVNTTTGLSWLDGTQGSSEVVFNAAQAKQLYDIVHSGDFGHMMGENILSGLRDVLGQIKSKNSSQSTPNVLNVSFPNANINAESYESFKGFMDKYTNDLFMQLQTGKK